MQNGRNANDKSSQSLACGDMKPEAKLYIYEKCAGEIWYAAIDIRAITIGRTSHPCFPPPH